MGVKPLSTHLKQNCFLILQSVTSLAIIEQNMLSLIFFAISLNIMKAINLMISFCVSWWRYFCHFFYIQEVILGSTFTLNFINFSKLSSLLFPQKARPWRERNCIFRSMVRNVCLFLAFLQIGVSSKLSSIQTVSGGDSWLT